MRTVGHRLLLTFAGVLSLAGCIGATLTPTPAAVPPSPTGVTLQIDAHELANGEDAILTVTVSWRAPRADDVEIQVFGVAACLAEPLQPPPGSSGPCLLEDTVIPEEVRVLLVKAPASDGSVRWSWTEPSGCNIGVPLDPQRAYQAIVVAAANTSGRSDDAIAEPGGWWRPHPEETVC